MVCEGVGVSLPGRVDATGRLVFAPNLGWRDVDLRQMLEAATGLPVNVENAANACALGEVWFGRHDEHLRHLVAVTVSEGIGVGVLLNGQLVHGANAMAGEFGHMTLDESGPPVAAASADAGNATRPTRRPWTTTRAGPSRSVGRPRRGCGSKTSSGSPRAATVAPSRRSTAWRSSSVRGWRRS